MWRLSSHALLRKLTVKVESVFAVSVTQRHMSTVMSFESGWDGELGLPTVGMGKYAKAYGPNPIPSLPLDIVSVHVGHYQSFALTSRGQLWAWGRNEEAQLGRGFSDRESWNEPKKVEGLENVNVSFGWHHALAQTVDHKLFEWGCYENLEDAGDREVPIWEPRLVKELRGIQVLDTTCGPTHSLVVCRDGALLSCGDNQYGKLGRDGEDSIFLHVDISLRSVYVAAGPVHSMAICQLDESNSANVGTTKIASWGWNRHYELGRSGPTRLPGLIDGLEGENPISVSAGLAHSLALTSKGKLWVWGSGLFGTLGFDSPAKQPVPYYLDSLEGLHVLQAVAGYEHTVVLVAS